MGRTELSDLGDVLISVLPIVAPSNATPMPPTQHNTSRNSIQVGLSVKFDSK